MKELESMWDKNGNKLTRTCLKHGKIDCGLCAESRKWDELLKRAGAANKTVGALR